MCLSNNSYPEVRVDFNDTILLGLEVRDSSGLVEHVCGYYNTVSARAAAAARANADFGWPVSKSSSDDDFGWHVAPPAVKVGNAMLIAIPAEPGTVTAKSLIPVGKFPRLFEDYKQAVVPPAPRTRGLLLSDAKSFGVPVPLVVKGFDDGTYDVVISSRATSIASVIGQVDADKRPQLNQELYAQLDLLYPDFTFVLFCFSEEDKARSGCAVVKYQPRKGLEHLLYLPGLDGHNGKVETGDVELNHTLVVGSYDMKGGLEVSFSDPGLGLSGRDSHPIFLNRVIGKIIAPGTKAPQGDFLFKLDDVRKGTFRAKRELPPGWRNVFGQTGVPKQPYFIQGSASSF